MAIESTNYAHAMGSATLNGEKWGAYSDQSEQDVCLRVERALIATGSPIDRYLKRADIINFVPEPFYQRQVAKYTDLTAERARALNP